MRTLGEVDALQRRQVICEQSINSLKQRAAELQTECEGAGLGSGLWIEALLRVVSACLIWQVRQNLKGGGEEWRCTQLI